MNGEITILTHEEAKTKKLIPFYHIYCREDAKTGKFLVYIASKLGCNKFKTYEDFLNKVNKVLEGKSTVNETYVFEDGKWNRVRQIDITDRYHLDIYHVEDATEYENEYARIFCSYSKEDYILKEDLDEFIKNKQKKIVESDKIRKKRQDEYKKIFAWTRNLLNY